MSRLSDAIGMGVAGGLLNIDTEIKRRRQLADAEESQLRLLQRQAEIQRRYDALAPKYMQSDLGPIEFTEGGEGRFVVGKEGRKELSAVNQSGSQFEALRFELAQLEANRRQDDRTARAAEREQKRFDDLKGDYQESFMTEALVAYAQANPDKLSDGMDAETLRLMASDGWEEAASFVKDFNANKARSAFNTEWSYISEEVGNSEGTMDYSTAVESIDTSLQGALDRFLGNKSSSTSSGATSGTASPAPAGTPVQESRLGELTTDEREWVEMASADLAKAQTDGERQRLMREIMQVTREEVEARGGNAVHVRKIIDEIGRKAGVRF